MTGRHTSPCTALYCIYTSGSTGEPKGVVMEHRNLVAFSRLKAHDEGIGADRQSRVLLASTFTFDLCEGDLYASLITGGTVVTAPRDALLHDLPAVLKGRSVKSVESVSQTSRQAGRQAGRQAVE